MSAEEHVAAAEVERCPRCRHAPHDGVGFCPNMASDNDCDCTYDAADVPPVVLCTRKCAPGKPDPECVVHGHTWEPRGPWIVSELSLSGLMAHEVEAATAAGQPHPEATPVGPFNTRANADRWASRYVEAWGGGSWSIAPVHPPRVSVRILPIEPVTAVRQFYRMPRPDSFTTPPEDPT